MDRLISVSVKDDILPEYRETPIGLLLEYHNLNRPYEKYNNAELLVGMCMDHRKRLNIPDNFAYIIRSGGGNLRYSEFKISYAVSLGGVKAITIIAHNNCGMVNLMSKKKMFIDGLVDIAGWERDWAEDHFMHFAPMFEIGNEVDFVINECKRLRARYPKMLIAPLMYEVESNKLFVINEKI